MYSPNECLRRIMDLYTMSDTLGRRAEEVKICHQYSVREYYSSICEEELRKITKNLSQDSRQLDRDFNQTPPKYKSKVLVLHSVAETVTYNWYHEPLCKWYICKKNLLLFLILLHLNQNHVERVEGYNILNTDVV